MTPLPFWLWLNVLSLDAPLIAILWQNAFALAFGVHLTLAERLSLFCVVWIVYLGDRLLDGFRLKITSHSAPRHQFAARHPRIVFIFLGIAIPCALVSALVLPRQILLGGLAIGISTVFYFLWNQTARGTFSRKYFKEIIICVIFVLGVLLTPAMAGGSGNTGFLIGALLFFALCLSNCAMISRIERDIDIGRGEESYAVHFGQHLKPARWLSVLTIIATLILSWEKVIPWQLGIPLMLCAVGLWLTIYIERLSSLPFAVVWVDFCLMAPALTLWLS